MERKGFIYQIGELSKEHNDLVGKKCANLGELARIGVRVPPGFAISVEGWERFVRLTGIGEAMKKLFEEGKDQLKVPSRGQEVSWKARELIEAQDMPKEIGDEILNSYKLLSQKGKGNDLPVAVRSAGAISMPGAMESYLNVKGEVELLKKVKRVWSSSYTYRAILYRHHHNLEVEYAPIGIAVLHMVEAESAGVLMTANPTSGCTTELIIESNWGLGESVVSGIMNPDKFSVEKEGLEITDRVINRKLKMVIPEGNGTVLIDTPIELQEVSSLMDEEIRELARIALEIERHFSVPVDIEWAYDANIPFPQNLYFLQVRPMKALPQYKDPISKILDLMLKGSP